MAVHFASCGALHELNHHYYFVIFCMCFYDSGVFSSWEGLFALDGKSGQSGVVFGTPVSMVNRPYLSAHNRIFYIFQNLKKLSFSRGSYFACFDYRFGSWGRDPLYFAYGPLEWSPDPAFWTEISRPASELCSHDATSRRWGSSCTSF